MISKNMQKFKTDDEKHLSFAEFTRIYLQRLYGYQIRRNVFASDYLAHQYYQLFLIFYNSEQMIFKIKSNLSY